MNATDATIGEIGEGATLARIFPILPSSRRTTLGPGDDCAIVTVPDGRVPVTTDLMIEGPDFRIGLSTGYDIGWKACATNLADIAAMGATKGRRYAVPVVVEPTATALARDARWDAVLGILATEGRVNRQRVVEALMLSERTAGRLLAAMAHCGVLLADGSGRSQRYSAGLAATPLR